MKLMVLDRDGVINRESVAFIKTPEEWIPVPGSLEAIARLPVAQPDVVEPGAVKQAGVFADRELPHPLENQQLDLGDFRQVDERLDFLLSSSHGIGVLSMMSLITASCVRP